MDFGHAPPALFHCFHLLNTDSHVWYYHCYHSIPVFILLLLYLSPLWTIQRLEAVVIMGVASQVVFNGSVHSMLDVIMDHFEETRKCRIPWSSNTSMTSPRSTECSSSSDSSPRRPTTRLLTSEETLIEIKIKGNLLNRISWLEDHVLKLQEEMNAKRKMIMGGESPKSNKNYHGMRRKNHPSLVTEQLRRHLRRHRDRHPPGFNDKEEVSDATKAKQRSLLQKILHAGPIEKPLKGWNFLLGSCKGTLVEEKRKQPEKAGDQNVKREEPIHHRHLKIKRKKEEESMKKAVLPMVNLSKLKSLDGVEVSRVFSLQGIQSYTPWEMKYGR